MSEGIKLGNTSEVTKIYLGSSVVDRVFLGKTLIFPEVTSLKTNLLSCWEFNESIGNSPIDAHGSNDLTGTGVLTKQTGILDKCYKYDGVNDYCYYNASNNNLSPQSNHSISVWFKKIADTADNTNELIGKYYSSTGLRIYTFDTIKSTHATLPNYLRCSYYDTSNVGTTCQYAPGSDIWIGNWMHVVFTRAGSAMKLYVNGDEVATASGGNGSMQQTTNTAVKDMIGAQSKSTTIPDSFTNAYIDQTAVWRKALSADEIYALYNGGIGLPYTQW